MCSDCDLKHYEELRAKLDKAFSADTSYDGKFGNPPSAGHCAVVALIVYKLFGGELVSATVNGISHWFNRIYEMDVDLTADQFGHPGIAMYPANKWYYGTRVRQLSEVKEETWARARLLAHRAGIEGV